MTFITNNSKAVRHLVSTFVMLPISREAAECFYTKALFYRPVDALT
jgi:hypothetical protein